MITVFLASAIVKVSESCGKDRLRGRALQPQCQIEKVMICGGRLGLDYFWAKRCGHIYHFDKANADRWD